MKITIGDKTTNTGCYIKTSISSNRLLIINIENLLKEYMVRRFHNNNSNYLNSIEMVVYKFDNLCQKIVRFNDYGDTYDLNIIQIDVFGVESKKRILTFRCTY